jgi:tripartite ATP-independent transporter DctM subunit
MIVMGWEVAFILNSFVLLVLLVGGEWIAFGLGAAGLFALFLQGGTVSFHPLGTVIWNSVNNFTLTAIPLFVFMGEMVLHGGIGQRFYRGMGLIFSRLPGGLLQANIVSCAIFAAVTGVSVATAATVGTVAIPELSKRGYDREMIFGSLAGGGTLGILIPPSVPFIIYGVMAQESITDLFAAGIIPGIVLSLIFMTYIAIRVSVTPRLVPESREASLSLHEKFLVLVHVLPVFGLIFLVLGGIYFGIMTPTEAAAVGAFVSILLSACYGRLNFSNLKLVLSQTVRTTSMILFIMAGASIFSFALVNSGINRELTNWVVSQGQVQATFFILICIIYIIMGCFFDPISMVVLTMPILYPIVLKFGFNPIWYGVILVILIELGLITPPVGFNLFVIHGISGGRPMGEVIRGSFPYMLMMLLMITILYFFPQIAIWLPQALK